MPYDITFIRRLPGRTLVETLDHRNQDYDPDAEPEPMELTSAQRAAWEEIVRRVSV
ncbi:hypothetical protein ACFP1Z_29685 [Streptomyces gamaensis]|uniref:Uncharacterized protein n=1 Tax=Streptomyces gamaensis TaxID=1763542 RepID=A0ABW0Z8R5_9ACTN